MARQAHGVPDTHSTSARHVLIVGAGIAGPCLALSLAQHGIRSTLLEVRDAPSAGGGSISLGPNGLQVLDRYVGHGVYERLGAEGFTYRRFVAVAENGDKFGEIKVGYDEGQGYPAVRVMRTTLHHILLDAVEEEQKRGMIQIRYGAKVAQIEDVGDKVRAHFQDGSSAEGDCIIGADGTHSKVRQHVLGDKAPSPSFDRLCVVYGFLPASSIARIADAEASPISEQAGTDKPAVAGSTFALPGFVWTAAGMFMVIPHDKSGEQLAWCIVRSVEEDRTRAEWADFERSGEGSRLAKADYADIATEPLRSILDSSRDEDARLWASYSIPDIPRWSAGRACLIGDAAHAMPPNGQGASLALEDAAILTRLLVSTPPTAWNAELFARFERIRRPRIKKIRGTTDTSSDAKRKAGPWLWYLKKTVFRAFFWWKGGVLHHFEDAAYDVDGVDIENA